MPPIHIVTKIESKRVTVNKQYNALGLIAFCILLVLTFNVMGDIVITTDPRNDPPIANFTWSVFNKKVTFMDLSIDNSGNIANWTWDFGEGNTSINQNTLHFFQSFGNYNVTLNVTDEWGLFNETTKEVEVSSDTYPFKPMLISPVNNSEANTDAHLIVHVYDPDGDQLLVTFYNETGGKIDQITVLNDMDVETIWQNREKGITHWWYATVTDGSHTVISDRWCFTVKTMQIETSDTLFYGLLFLFISFAAIGEISYRMSGNRTTVLFLLVALLGFINVYIVWNWKWLVIFYLGATILYILRFGLAKLVGDGEL